jgi:hypothetical protein
LRIGTVKTSKNFLRVDGPARVMMVGVSKESGETTASSESDIGVRDVTLRVIWRRTLQAIWRILRVWTNWQVSRKKSERSPLIVSACNRDFCRVTVIHQSSEWIRPSARCLRACERRLGVWGANFSKQPRSTATANVAFECLTRLEDDEGQKPERGDRIGPSPPEPGVEQKACQGNPRQIGAGRTLRGIGP